MPEKSAQQQIAQDQLDLARQKLAGMMPLRVAYQDIPLLGTKELTRSWPEVSPEDEKLCVRYLNLFTDAKNTGDPQFYVDDPMTDKGIVPGRWRNAGAQISKQASGLKGVIQVLRLGYADTINWDEAHIEEDDYDHATTLPYGIKVIRWVGIDPHNLAALSRSFSAHHYSNFVVQGEAYSETWNNIKVKTSLAEDGSGIIQLTIALDEFAFTAYTMDAERQVSKIQWQYVPKEHVQTILNLYSTPVTGFHTDVDVSYNESSELSTITITQDSITSQTTHDYSHNCAETSDTVKVTAADAQEVVGTVAPGTKVDIFNEPGPYGKYKTTVKTTTAQDQTSLDSIDAGDESVLDTEHTQNPTALGAAAASDGQIVENNNAPTDFCQYATVNRVRTVNSQPGHSYETDAEHTSEDVLNTATTPDFSAAPTPSIGQQIAKSSEPTAYKNRWRQHVKTTAALNQTAISTTTSPPGTMVGGKWDETQKLVTHADLPGAESVAALQAQAAAEAGKIKTLRLTPTPFGTYNALLTIRNGKYQYFAFTYPDRYGDSYYAHGENATLLQFNTAKTAAAFTTGTSNAATAAYNEFGLIDFTFTKTCYDNSNSAAWEWGLRADYQVQHRGKMVQTSNGQWYTVIDTYQVKIYIETSMSYAGARCDGGLTSSPAGSSGVDRWTNGQYRATNISYVGQTTQLFTP